MILESINQIMSHLCLCLENIVGLWSIIKFDVRNIFGNPTSRCFSSGKLVSGGLMIPESKANSWQPFISSSANAFGLMPGTTRSQTDRVAALIKGFSDG